MIKKIMYCVQKINSLEGSLFVYSLSFSLLLAIAPMLTVFVKSFEWFNIDVGIITAFVSLYLPSEIVLPFVKFLLGKSVASQITSLISLIISLYLASRCVYSFLLISAQDEEITYPKWSLRVYSLFEFFIIYLYIMVSIILTTFLSKYHSFLGTLGYLIVSILGFYLFYHLCTFKKRERTYGLAGALFTSICIFLVGVLFFQMVARFTHYDSIYGPLASFMILLLSVFVISSIIYIGYILNLVFMKNKAEENRKNLYFHLCEEIQKRIISVLGGQHES